MQRIKEELTSKERVSLALEHKTTDRIPICLICSGFNPPVWKSFDEFLRENCNTDIDTYINSVIDTKEIWSTAGYKPKLKENEDIWGVIRKKVSYGSGSYNEIEYYPLEYAKSPKDIDNHSWPETSQFDYSVYEGIIKQAKSPRDEFIILSNANLFESSWYMRGFEQMFIDMVTNPDLFHTIMEHVTSFYIQHFKNILQLCKGKIDIVFTADDIGGQEGLLMSIKMWEEFIKPYHIRLNKVLHEFGVKVIYHSDGSIMKAVDGLIDMGIDVLQALQFNAKDMDPEVLKSNHGGKLCFEGGVCVQNTLPFKNKEQVIEEVKSLINILGKDGGYLLGPSHGIQAGTPPENIYAMFETALSYYPHSN